MEGDAVFVANNSHGVARAIYILEQDDIARVDTAGFAIGDAHFRGARDHDYETPAGRRVPVCEESWWLDRKHSNACLAGVRAHVGTTGRGRSSPIDIFEVGLAICDMVNASHLHSSNG